MVVDTKFDLLLGDTCGGKFFSKFGNVTLIVESTIVDWRVQVHDAELYSIRTQHGDNKQEYKVGAWGMGSMQRILSSKLCISVDEHKFFRNLFWILGSYDSTTQIR